MKKLLFLLACTLAGITAQSQGTLVFDQESSSDETPPIGGSPIQFYGSVGQSFTPSLSTVGFIRVKMYDINPGNTIGATLVMNLRSNAINGPIIGTATPVVFTNGFTGSVNFFFAFAVAVVPNLTYFFETSVQSGDTWGIRNRSDSQGDDNYPGGVYYGGTQPFSAADLWFREGIVVVPEPTSASVLLLVGLGVCYGRRRC
jgi:hypothetical protein